MTTVIARALKTPHCHACCEEKSSSHASAPCGVAIATSTLRSCCTPRQRPMRNAAMRRLHAPVRLPAGPHKTAPAPHQRLAQAGCRVIPRAAVDGVLGTPRCRASGFASREARLLPVFHRLFQPHPTGRQVSRRGRDSAERRPMAASYTRAQFPLLRDPPDLSNLTYGT
jgi:hypothetical protein